MKTKKLMLPVMAFICAIGMAFATVDLKPEPKVQNSNYSTMYVHSGNAWHTIDVECGQGNSDCLVIFSEDPSGTIYQVYNSRNLNDPARGNGEVKQIQGPPPSN